MENINTEVHNAYEIIKEGGIILYPTDTVWGIGCDATNEEAIKKIYALKKRVESKSMIVLMNSERMIYNVFKEVPEVAWQILDLSENPTTLILDNPRNVAKNIIAADNTLGVRLVTDPFCFKLMKKIKKPICYSKNSRFCRMFSRHNLTQKVITKHILRQLRLKRVRNWLWILPKKVLQPGAPPFMISTVRGIISPMPRDL